jgi:valyl-tRNA synthetase
MSGFGIFFHFKYEIEATIQTIGVATTRMETMLGDTDVSMHLGDEHYKHLVGKDVIHCTEITPR